MIKLVIAEENAPVSKETAHTVGNSSGVRAVNTSRKNHRVWVNDIQITIPPNETNVLKNSISDKVYASSKEVLIAGVSIY